MKEIKEHIKSGQYKRIYLLYGSELYLRRLYTGKLKKGALGSGDMMNLSTFSGKETDFREVQSLAETVPFFADHRVIVLEDTGAFKAACDFADVIPSLPDFSVLIFNESEVDKRSRMFKAVKEFGYAAEINGLSENELCMFVAQKMNKDNKKIARDDVLYLLNRVGTDLDNLECEVEKLVSYALDHEVITRTDIDKITCEQITGKIFAMTDAIGAKNRQLALSLYQDLLSVREKPPTILYLCIRQCNQILLASEMNRQGLDKGSIAAKLSIPPFAVSKLLSSARNFQREQLLSLVSLGTELEEKMKTGRMEEHMAVELFLLQAVTK